MYRNSTEWLVHNHVIITKLTGWDADSLFELMTRVNDMVNQSNLPLVHTIWDLNDVEKYSTNLNDIRKSIQPLFLNQQLGWVVTVIGNPMLGFIAQAGSSMYGVRYRSFKTMNEATAFLREMDATIPPIE